MRGIGVLCLVVGFLLQLVLNGQVYDSALGGIVLGLIAALCGLTSTRSDYRNRGSGWMITTAGLALAIWCSVSLPSAYEFQQKFNNRKHRIQDSTSQPSGMQSMPYHSRHAEHALLVLR